MQNNRTVIFLPTFTWKVVMLEAEKNLSKRIKILEQTGNVECTIRTKRNYAKLQKKIKEMWQNVG